MVPICQFLWSPVSKICRQVRTCQSPVPRFAPTLHVPLDMSAVAMCVCVCVFGGVRWVGMGKSFRCFLVFIYLFFIFPFIFDAALFPQRRMLSVEHSVIRQKERENPNLVFDRAAGEGGSNTARDCTTEHFHRERERKILTCRYVTKFILANIISESQTDHLERLIVVPSNQGIVLLVAFL